MGVDPDESGRHTARARQPLERSHRDRMIAAKHDGHSALRNGALDDARQIVADLRDHVVELCRRILRIGRLADRNGEVSVIDDLRDSKRCESLVEFRVANRRGTHIDAATARAEVHRDSDDIHAPYG